MMPDAAAVVAWLEVLEQPEMSGFVLLTSVLKQARPLLTPQVAIACLGLGIALQHAAQH